MLEQRQLLSAAPAALLSLDHGVGFSLAYVTAHAKKSATHGRGRSRTAAAPTTTSQPTSDLAFSPFDESGLSDADIGSPAIAGSASYSGGTYTVAGSGTQISGTSDQFNFASQSFTGDGSIVAEATSRTITSAGVGVMFRNDSTAGSAYAAMFVTSNNDVAFQWRAAAGGSTSETLVSGKTTPVWLKLTRVGDSFSGYYSTDGSTWTQIGTNEAAAVSNNALAGLAVTSHSNTAINTATFTNLSITTSPALPSGWTDSDVGSPTYAGGATFDGTTYTIAGSGAQISGTSDQFNFASQSFTGDGSIVAEVTSRTITSAGVGVMFRNDSTAGSAYAATFVTSNNDVAFQWRAAAGGSTSETPVGGVTTPVWLKLTRVGDSFSGYYSTDGSTWTQIGTAESATVSSNALAGLAVTSHSNTTINTATFANVAGTDWLPAPTGLTAVGTVGEVDLSWTAVSGATSYDIYRSATSGDEGSTPYETGVTFTYFSDTGLAPSTSEYYTVTAITPSGTTLPSAEASATSDGLPEAPTSLTATAAGGGGGVTLAWAPSPDALTYNIYRGTSSLEEGSTPIATGDPAAMFTDTTAAPDTTYYYYVTSVNEVGEGSASNETSALTVPAAPTGLTATAGDTTIALAWNAVAGATSYNLYQGTAPGDEGSTPEQTGLTGTTFTDSSLDDGTTYYYTLTAINASGEGIASAEVKATPVATAPTVATAAAATLSSDGTTVTLTTLGADAGGESNLKYSWAATTPDGVDDPFFSDSYDNTAKDTTATLFGGGDYTFTVTITNNNQLSTTSSVSLDVSQIESSVYVTPPMSTLAPSEADAFSAVALDQFGNSMATQPSFTWGAIGGAGGTIDTSGNYTASTATTGTDTITATTDDSSTLVGTATATLTATGLATPGDVFASPADGEVDLSWDADPNAATYDIYRGTIAGRESTTPFATGLTDSTFSDTAATDGETYYYTVTAVSSFGTGATSAEVSATPEAAPAAPSDLSAAAVSSNEIDLSWTDNSGGTAGFVIERSDDGGNTFNPIDTVDPGTTTYQDTSVSDGVTEVYEVAAYNTAAPAVQSSFSNTATASTPLAAPDYFTATAASTSEIDLSWIDGSEVAQTDAILYSTNGSTYNTLTTVTASGSSNSFAATGLSSGTTYYYELQARQTIGTSTTTADSTIVTATTHLAVPTSVTASASTSAVTVSWATVTGATGYSIGRSGGGSSGEAIIGATDAPGTSYVDSNIVQGKSYTYSVIAYDDTDRSDASSGNSVTVPLGAPSAPTGVTAAALSSTSVEVAWQNTSTNESGFIVQIQNSDSSWSNIGSELSATQLSYQVQSLTADTSYVYRVEAANSAGTGASTTVTVTTPTTPMADSPVGPVTFQGDIDGDDYLHMEGNHVWLTHGQFNEPDSLTVDGMAGSYSTTWTTGTTLGYAGSISISWHDNATDGTLGNVSIVQQPSAGNGYEAVVWINDDPPSGAHVYDVTVSPGAASTPQIGIQSAGSSANAVGPDGNPQPAWFVLTRSGGDISEPTDVQLSYSGDALFTEDVGALPTDVVIPAGQVAATFQVNPLNKEPDMGTLLTATIRTASTYTIGNPQASIEIQPHGLGITLGGAEPGNVLIAAQGIPSGPFADTVNGDLYSLMLAIPQNQPYGSQVTLNVSDPSAAYIFSSPTTADPSGLLDLSAGGSYTWTLSPDLSQFPAQLFVQAYDSSGKPLAVKFTLTDTTKTATVAPPFPSSASASTPVATVEQVKLDPPSNLTATYQTNVAPGDVKLSWDASDTPVSNYLILGTTSSSSGLDLIADVPAGTTSYVFHPTFNGPYAFVVQSDLGNQVPQDSTTATCQAIGGPDISNNLLIMKNQLNSQVSSNQSVRKALGWEWLNIYDASADWEVHELVSQTVSTPDNLGVLPDGEHTVSVNGSVWDQAAAAYWLYGMWTGIALQPEIFGADNVVLFRIYENYKLGQSESISQRLEWYYAGFAAGTPAPFPNTTGVNVKASTEKYKGDLYWHIGFLPPYIVDGHAY